MHDPIHSRSSAAAGAHLPWMVRTAIAVVALAATLAFEWVPTLQGYAPAPDFWLRDAAMRIAADKTVEQRLTVIDIDEASIQRLGPWPWPRDRIADLAEILLARYGARSVALDMVLPDPGSAGADARLAALGQHAPLVMAQALDYVPRPTPLRVGTLTGAASTLPVAPMARATGFIANHTSFAGARCIGNIGFVPDRDGVLRHIPLLTHFEDKAYPALSLALLQCAGESPALPSAALADSGLWPLPFARSWAAYTVIGAADVLAESAPRDRIAGRYVIVGSSALGLSDRVATPLTASTSGTLVHAAALTALLDQQSGAAPTPWAGRMIASLFSLAIVAIALLGFPRLSAARSLGLLALATLGWLGLAWMIMPHDLFFSPTAPLLTLLILLAAAIPFEWGRAQWESRRLLDMFQHYVAPPVLDELLRARGRLDPLAPRYLEVTTLISDMEGYATLVEGHSLEEAVALTRGFLDCLTGPVLDHGGTLDKYTGDGLMAFWGAPLPMADHADQALAAAREIRQRVAEFNQTRIAAGKPAVRVRIGVESGLAVVGDLGTPFRSAYTAVGDSVNVASRLQELARDLPHDILVGSRTARLARMQPLITLGQTHLRGRHQAEEIFALEEGATQNDGTQGLQGFQPELAI